MVDSNLPQLQRQISSKVKISIDEILEKYDCPICMCKLSEPHIVKCGHTFCKVSWFLFFNNHSHMLQRSRLSVTFLSQNCIFECVNRQHECPACRAKCTKEDIYRNYSLEVLLQKLNDEREHETQRYFNNLANNVIIDQNEKLH